MKKDIDSISNRIYIQRVRNDPCDKDFSINEN